MGAKYLKLDLKLGSKIGVIKSQFIRAPPITAIRARAVVLIVCASSSDEYCLGGL